MPTKKKNETPTQKPRTAPAAERPRPRIRACDICHIYGIPLQIYPSWGMLCNSCAARHNLSGGH